MPENYRDGYISVSQFYNFFHGGFCGPYIRNPHYMLIVDFRFELKCIWRVTITIFTSKASNFSELMPIAIYFRTREEFEESHIVTAIHYQSIDWDRKDIIEHAQR